MRHVFNGCKPRFNVDNFRPRIFEERRHLLSKVVHSAVDFKHGGVEFVVDGGNEFIVALSPAVKDFAGR